VLFYAEMPSHAQMAGPAKAHGIAGVSVVAKISNWC
jgi:hypothetical protein